MKINDLHNLCNVENTGILHNEAETYLNEQGFALADIVLLMLQNGMQPALAASYPP